MRPPEASGGAVLTHLSFELYGHRYYAKVDRSTEPWRWRVSVDGGPRHEAFPPRADDEDTESFRRRLAAACGEGPEPGSPWRKGARDRRQPRST
jgi:hypothetical protein